MTNGTTELPEKNGKGQVPDEPDLDPSLLDSSSKKKKRNKKKKRRKNRKDDSSDPSSSDNSDWSNDSDYRCKRHKKKIHWEKDPIKLCAGLTAKLLMTAYKLNIIESKGGRHRIILAPKILISLLVSK